MIPFNKPYLPVESFGNLRQAVVNQHISGDGPFTEQCHAWLERAFGIPKVLLTTSCTHSLEMAALLIGSTR
jgi:dTDP-4-amino-4,6-dideoxygalactose transaminase